MMALIEAALISHLCTELSTANVFAERPNNPPAAYWLIEKTAAKEENHILQATVAVHPVEDVNYPLIGGEEASHYTITYDLPKIIAAPTKEGQIVGRLLLNYDGQPVGSVDLAAEKVDAGMSVGSLFVRVFGWLLPTL